MLHQDAVTFLGRHFTPEGFPTPAHQKCLAQFRSAFWRSVRRKLHAEGGVAGEVKYTTEYGPRAARFLAEVRLTETNLSCYFEDAPKLVTPFLKKMGFAYPCPGRHQRTLLHGDWDAFMMRHSHGFVAGDAHVEAEGVLVMRAVMIFHHPQDALAQEAWAAAASGWSDQGLGENSRKEWHFQDGILHWCPPHQLFLRDRSSLKWGRNIIVGRLGDELWSLELYNHCDGRGIALAEAASNPRARFRDLKVLADRLGISTGESCVEELRAEDPAVRDTLQTPFKAWAYRWARLGMPSEDPTVKSFSPKSPPPSEDPQLQARAVAYNDRGASASVTVRLTSGSDPGVLVVLDLFNRPYGIGAQEDLIWRPPPNEAALNLSDPAQLQAVCEKITARVLTLLREMGETHHHLNFNPNR